MADETPADPDVVVLQATAGPIKTRLVVPNSLGLRYEVVYAVAKSEPRSVAAALGLCSSTLRRAVQFDHDVMAFGARVIDHLLEQGVPYQDILTAGRHAWRLCNNGLLHAAEVKAAEDFTEPSTAGSTG